MDTTRYNLTVTCDKCHHFWTAFPRANVTFPTKRYLKCPNCSTEFEKTWYDEETKIKLEQKRLGLLPEPPDKSKLEVLDKRIDAVEAKIIAITTEQELIRTKLDIITKDQLQKLHEDITNHEFSITSINDRVTKIDSDIEHAKRFGRFEIDK